MLCIEIMAGLVITLTFWSLIPRNEWWFRGADFPRLQILVLGIVAAIALTVCSAAWTVDRDLLLIGLIIALAYQLKMVLPYTFVWKKQVKTVLATDAQAQQQISLLVSNVLMTNTQYHLLLAQIAQLKPDVVLTLETDLKWQNALQSLEADYPYRVAVPLDNLYGMHLYSRLALQNTAVKFLLSDEITSIYAQIILKSGQPVDIYCLHPQPPSPTEAQESTLRDAELLMVGNAIKDRQHSCIVMGDLNDVAWSRTTQLFQRISGLLDPRVGRHFINTFHADYFFLRWSLDHIFHSTDFALIEMKRLPHIGSDHFPVYTVLQIDPKFEAQQHALPQTEEDEQDAQQKIQEGIEKSKDIEN